MAINHISQCIRPFAAGNESCPQPQTSEHLAAIEIMKLKHILIMQNKIDLVKESQAKEQHDQIVKFVQGAYRWLDHTEHGLMSHYCCHLCNSRFQAESGLTGFTSFLFHSVA